MHTHSLDSGQPERPRNWTDQQLIDELILRKRLMVVTARRQFPDPLMLKRPGFLEAITNKIAEDVGQYMLIHGLIEDDFEYDRVTNGMTFYGQSVVLLPLPKEKV